MPGPPAPALAHAREARRPRRARAAATLALAGATGLAPGCAALIGYGDRGLGPFRGVRASGAALAGLTDEPGLLLFVGPLILADSAASLAIDLVLLPFAALRELQRVRTPASPAPPRRPRPVPSLASADATPPVEAAPAEPGAWATVMGRPPAATEPDEVIDVAGPAVLERFTEVCVGERGRLRLLAVEGRRAPAGRTSVAAVAVAPDAVAFGRRSDVELVASRGRPAQRWPTALGSISGLGLASPDVVVVGPRGARLIAGPGSRRSSAAFLDVPVGARAVAIEAGRAALGGWGGQVQVWSLDGARGPQRVAVTSVAEAGAPADDAWVPALTWLDERTLLLGRGDGALLAWRALDGPPGDLQVTGESPEVVVRLGAAPLALTREGETVLAGLVDGGVVSLRLRGAAPATEWPRTRLGRHDGPVVAVALEGDVAASGGLDGVVRLWSLRAGREVERVELAAIDDAPAGLAIVDGGRGLIVVTRRGLTLRYGP